MADELETFGDGSVSMMYVAEDGDPWHGKGTPVNGAQTGDQAAEAAGLKWSVRLEPISTQWSIKDAAGTVLDRVPSELPEKFAVVREPYRDTPATPLAVVGDRYQILQNADCFGFFDQLVGEGQAIFRTAGSLFGGRRIWLAAKLPKDMVLLKEDIIEQYLVLASSHDGSMSVTTLFTPIRVVCANTLAMATSQARSSYTFRHQGDMKARFKEAAQALGFATRYYAELEEALKRFTEVSMPETRIEEFVNRFIPMPDKKDRSVLETVATGDAAEKFDRARSNAETGRLQLRERIETGKGTEIAGVRGSLYGVYQGATEYVDWDLAKQSRSADTILKSKLIGKLSDANVRAFDLAKTFSRN